MTRCGTNVGKIHPNEKGNSLIVSGGNIYSSRAEAIPDLDKCHERKSDRIWRAEITYKEVNSQEHTKTQSRGMKQ